MATANVHTVRGLGQIRVTLVLVEMVVRDQVSDDQVSDDHVIESDLGEAAVGETDTQRAVGSILTGRIVHAGVGSIDARLLSADIGDPTVDPIEI